MKKSRKERLISDCSLIIASLARKALRSYKLPTLEYEDLVQEGYIAALKAVRNYDPSKGVKFSSYARVSVLNSIKEAAFQDNLVRLPLDALNQANRDFYKQYFQQFASFRSLDKPVGEGTATLHDLVGKADEPIESERPEDSQDRDYLEKVASAVLTDREKEVLGRTFGTFGYEAEKNRRKIAEAMNIGRTTVFDTKKRALRKMQSALRSISFAGI